MTDVQGIADGRRRFAAWLLAGFAVLGVEPATVAWAQSSGRSTASPRLVVQAGHGKDVKSLAFSPDGRTVLSASEDGSLKLWDVATGRELHTYAGHAKEVTGAVFLPDGRTAVSGSWDETLRRWDVASGRELGAIPLDECTVTSVAIAADGNTVASGCLDNSVRLVDLSTGRQVRALAGHGDAVRSIAFSPDGRTLLSGGDDRTLRLWEVSTGRALHSLTGHAGNVVTVGFSPAGNVIASGSADKTIRLWDPASGRELRSLAGHDFVVESVAFSPDGRTLLSGSTTLKLWDVASGRELRTLSARYASSAAFSPDGATAVFANRYQNALRVVEISLKLVDVSTGREIRTITGHGEGVRSVAFSPDGRTLVSGTGNRTIRIWDLANGQKPRTLDGRHRGGVRSLAFSVDGRAMVSGDDFSVKSWDLNTDRELRTFAEDKQVWVDATLSPDGGTVASGGKGNTVKLWDVATGRELRALAGHSSSIRSVAFSPDGKMLFSGSGLFDRSRLWDVATGRELRAFEDHGQTGVRAAAFSPDGRTLAGASHGTLKLWDLAAGGRGRTLAGHTAAIESVAFSSDSRIVATAGDDMTIRLWDAATGQALRTLAGHRGSVKSVAFSPDGATVASGSEDRTIRLWNVADGALLATLATFFDASPDADGRWAVVDPEGRFDVADLENTLDLHWVMPDDPLNAVPLEVFMRDYYEPRLLVRILNREKLKPVRPLAGLKRVQPAVRIVGIDPDPDSPAHVNVRLEANGARHAYPSKSNRPPETTAVHDLRLFRNGQMVGHAEGRLADAAGDPFRRGFRVRLPAGGESVQFTAYAFNDDRVKSATAGQSYAPPRAIVGARPRAYLVNVGVNRHENPAWDLRYAANDAREVGRSLEARLKAQGRYDAIVVVPLVSEAEGPNLATKANLKAVLDVLAGRKADVGALPGGGQLRQATPDDLVLVSFSGHGYTESGLFYLIPSDTGPGRGNAPTPELAARAISSDELSAWLRDVDAGVMAMIVDACHSAASVGEGFKPGPMGSRGLGQLAFDKGMRILAASQADDVALESDLTRQGLLSFALVRDGLEERHADYKPADRRITLEEWLNYGVGRVPTLAQEVRSGRITASRGAGEARAVVRISGGESVGKRPVQLPALFDFTKGRRDVVLDAGTIPPIAQAALAAPPGGRVDMLAAAQADAPLPARPQIPFPVGEEIWKAIESSSAYRQLPRARQVRVRFQSSRQFESAPSAQPVESQVEIVEKAPIGEKCSETRRSRDAAGSQVTRSYSCGNLFFLLGITREGQVQQSIKTLGELTGGLFPMRVGAEQSVRYTSTDVNNPKLDRSASQRCRVTDKRPANTVHPTLTGTAWAVQCESTFFQVGKPSTSTIENHYLEDLGVFLSEIGVYDSSGKRYVLPSPGSRTVFESGEPKQRMITTYVSYEWKVGE